MTKILVAYLTIDTLSIQADAMAVHLVDIKVKNQTKVTAIKVQAAVGTCTAHRIVCPWKILTKTVDMDDEDHTRKGGHGNWTRSRKSGNEITKLLLTSSKWKLALVGLLLGLFCAVAHQSYVWIKSERSSSGYHD